MRPYSLRRHKTLIVYFCHFLHVCLHPAQSSAQAPVPLSSVYNVTVSEQTRLTEASSSTDAVKHPLSGLSLRNKDYTRKINTSEPYIHPQ
jgi:hypothetical protein